MRVYRDEDIDLALVKLPEELPEAISMPVGEAQLSPDFYRPIVKALSNGPMRVGDLLNLPDVVGRREMFLIGLVLFTIPLFVLYQLIVDNIGVSLLMTVIMIVAGFVFTSVSAYMAGLVGSSNNPVSGITICTILFASLLLVVVLAAVRRRSLRVGRAALPLAALSGLGDMTANALFLLATQQSGQLAVVGVLASLYPVSTVVLAQLVLRERLGRTQLTGLGTAVAAVVLITLP